MQPDWETYIVPVRLVPLWVRLPPTTNVGPLLRTCAAVDDALNAQLPWVNPRLLVPPHPASARAKTPASSDKTENLEKPANFMKPPGGMSFGTSTNGMTFYDASTFGKIT